MTAATLPLAHAISGALSDSIDALQRGEANDLLNRVTPVTSELLRWWFQDDFVQERTVNFHRGQMDAVLAIIYAHEVLETTSLKDLYEKTGQRLAFLERFGEITSSRNEFPKYAAKMATGTGKTWVLNALLVWQRLNFLATPSDARFTSNFLIVAPGLIVYDRLLDSFCGRRSTTGARDFSTSDIATNQSLFVPTTSRDSVLAFVNRAVVAKHEIGHSVSRDGVIALTNWHLLAGAEEGDFLERSDQPEVAAPGADVDARAAAASFIPLSPGTSAGNSLDTLDRRARSGEALRWLKELPSLAVFNDEAHHVHSLSKGEADNEVRWQRTMTDLVGSHGRRMMQVDFSATPYSIVRGSKVFFPHVVVDFPLTQAMQLGLVKAIALDKRQEIASLPNDDLDFSAVRDERNVVVDLSEGQRVMIKAGLGKLEILEEQFGRQDADKHPKLLIMVEDTKVSPLVEAFLLSSGVDPADILLVDSGRKKDLGPAEWDAMRDRLFDLDSHTSPRIVVSVLMLREGFDVNNICVIVPLRSAQSDILVEQTIGRGLRLMWRNDSAVDEQKADTRARIQQHKAPLNYFDVLFLVEHPRFSGFYENEFGHDLITEVDEDTASAVGDTERVTLRNGFEAFDFEIPFVIQDVEEEMAPLDIDVTALPISIIPLADLQRYIGARGDTFMSHDLQTALQYGQFQVDGAKMTATGYNDYLTKLTTRVTAAIDRTFTLSGHLKAQPMAVTLLQSQRTTVMRAVDDYIRTWFFGGPFDPNHAEDWRVLLLDVVSDRIASNLAAALIDALEVEVVGEPAVVHRMTSEIDWLSVRSSSSVEVVKCIYPKLPVPSRSGGLERLFLEWADRDPEIEALLKIHEYKHDFLRRPYVKEDAMPAMYSPDFLVRTEHEVFVVETKAQSALSDANVKRKLNAALSWCTRLNALPANMRSNRTWHYALLGESNVREWHSKGMSASNLLRFSKIARPGSTQFDLFDL